MFCWIPPQSIGRCTGAPKRDLHYPGACTSANIDNIVNLFLFERREIQLVSQNDHVSVVAFPRHRSQPLHRSQDDVNPKSCTSECHLRNFQGINMGRVIRLPGVRIANLAVLSSSVDGPVLENRLGERGGAGKKRPVH